MNAITVMIVVFIGGAIGGFYGLPVSRFLSKSWSCLG